MKRAWLAELAAHLGLLVLAGGIGAVFGMPLPALTVAAVGLLGWHLWHLQRLWHWLRDPRAIPMPNARGVWGEVYGYLHAAQQRRQRRVQSLRELLQRFEESADALPDAIVVLDIHNHTVWWNPAAAYYLGLRSGVDTGRRIDTLMRHPDFTEYLQAERFEEPVTVPAPARKGTSLSVRIVPYGRDERLMQARDVTQVLRLESMRRDFIANVSHELRTPLTVLHGYLENLTELDAERDGEWGSLLQQMTRQSERMGHLVNNLLLLSRLETGGKAGDDPVAVPELLEELREEAMVLSGDRGHVIHLDVDPDLQLLGHRQELRSAFMNLVGNAVRYTPPGGRIDLRWYEQDGEACCEVVDTGIGIDAHHIPRITERFYRVDVARSRDTGGTGLGLAIVKHVLNRHDGRLEIDSNPDQGSVFRCTFPGTRVHHSS